MSDVQEAVTKAKEFQEQKRKPKKWSEAAKQAHSERMTKYFRENPEKRAELSEKIRGGWTKERRKEFSKRMKRVLADREVRQKISEGLKKHWDSYRRWKEENSKSE